MQGRQTRCFFLTRLTHRNQRSALRKWLLPLWPGANQPSLPGSDKRGDVQQPERDVSIWSDWEFGNRLYHCARPYWVLCHTIMAAWNGLWIMYAGSGIRTFQCQVDLVITEGQQAVRSPFFYVQNEEHWGCHDEPHTFCVHWAIDTWGKGANGWLRTGLLQPPACSQLSPWLVYSCVASS